MPKLRGLSLFANVGVAETYLDLLDVKIEVANEYQEDRARFYREIHPGTLMIQGDITHKDVMCEVIKESRARNVDFVMATPPCQGMSDAGLRKEFDERNQLIFYAIDAIRQLNPRFVLLENVPQQLKTKIRLGDEIVLIPEYVKRTLGRNYNFNKQTLVMAKDYGVPQIRERNIFLLVRKDQGVEWEFPVKQKPITLKDAIGNLPSLDPLLREGLEMTLEKFPNFEKKRAAAVKISKWHRPPVHPWRQVEWMMHTPTGKSATFNEVYFPQKADGSRIVAHHNHYRRLRWDMPCRTITQSNGSISSLANVHPGHPYKNGSKETLYSDPRVLSLYELFIVSSLPKDWPVPEWASESLIREVVGEGIPPALVKAIVSELVKKI